WVNSIELKAESAAEEGIELLAMQGEDADSRGGGNIAAGISGLAAKNFLQLWGDETPGSHVLRFFLAPDQTGIAAVIVRDFRQAIAVQGIELFDADDSDLLDLVFGAVVAEIVIHLAGAKNDPVALFRVNGIVD